MTLPSVALSLFFFFICMGFLFVPLHQSEEENHRSLSLSLFVSSSSSLSSIACLSVKRARRKEGRSFLVVLGVAQISFFSSCLLAVSTDCFAFSSLFSSLSLYLSYRERERERERLDRISLYSQVLLFSISSSLSIYEVLVYLVSREFSSYASSLCYLFF